MNAPYKHTVVCPYCSQELKYITPEDERVKMEMVIRCDGEEGGCDRRFVVTLETKIDVTTDKIVGE